jgi:hypothetical protein
MIKLIYLFAIFLIFNTSAFGIGIKNLNVQTEYTLSKSDNNYLLAITSPVNKVVKVIVPTERFSSFSTGTVVSGVALSDGTLHIVPENNTVMILQPDNAYRTRKQGSSWTLTRIGRDFWVLDGDLYSLEVDAYVGEDITIKANVEPSATGPLKFTWYKNNIVLPGKTESMLKLSNVTTVDSGNYKVDAYNSVGIVKSETTNLMVR